MKTALVIDGVTAGHLAGRGRLTGQVDVRDGRVYVRLDDEQDPAFWAELVLDLGELQLADLGQDSGGSSPSARMRAAPARRGERR